MPGHFTHVYTAHRLADWLGENRTFNPLDVGDGEARARKLWTEAAVRVLPGAYLCAGDGTSAAHAAPYVRLALIHEPAEIEEAMTRILRVLAADDRSVPHHLPSSSRTS